MKRKRPDLTHISRIKSIDSCIITCHQKHRQNKFAISRILILTLPLCVLSILPLVKSISGIQENRRTYIQE